MHVQRISDLGFEADANACHLIASDRGVHVVTSILKLTFSCAGGNWAASDVLDGHAASTKPVCR